MSELITRWIMAMSFATLLLSCDNSKKETAEILRTTNHPDSKIEGNRHVKNKTKILSFENFKNSKWIIGEEGLNGEKPDTIIFVEPTKLVYVSTDTGRSICNYIFSKDTLIYTSTEMEFDVDLDEEVNFEVTNKLLYRDNRFIYLLAKKRNIKNNSITVDNLQDLNLTFKKIK